MRLRGSVFEHGFWTTYFDYYYFLSTIIILLINETRPRIRKLMIYLSKHVTTLLDRHVWVKTNVVAVGKSRLWVKLVHFLSTKVVNERATSAVLPQYIHHSRFSVCKSSLSGRSACNSIFLSFCEKTRKSACRSHPLTFGGVDLFFCIINNFVTNT